MGSLAIKPRWLRWLAIGGILLFSAWSLSNFYWNEKYDKENAKGALAYVQAAEPKGSQLISIGDVTLAMEYYANRNITVIAGCFEQDDSNSTGLTREIDQTRSLWVVAGRDWNNSVQSCLSRLSQSYAIAGHKALTGVKLWALTPLD